MDRAQLLDPETGVTAPTAVLILAADELPVTPRRRASELSNIRRSTTLRTRGLELPACFELATIAAATNALDRTTQSAKASRRRAVEKATRLAGGVK